MGLELTSYIQAADDSKRSDSPVEHSALSEIVSLVLEGCRTKTLGCHKAYESSQSKKLRDIILRILSW